MIVLVFTSPLSLSLAIFLSILAKSSGRLLGAALTQPRLVIFDMELERFLAASVILCFLANSTAIDLKNMHEDYSKIYNATLAKTLVEYVSAVYVSDLTELFTWTCSRCTDLTRGFEMIELLFDVQNCLEAYVGVAHDLNSIIIVFRGTQKNSIQNWIEDLFWKQLDLKYPEMPDAMVHHGFYSAYHNTTIRPGVLNAIEKCHELYGDIPIMVAGHSMGGAMASFCALDLVINKGIDNVKLMTFGQPRVGNAAFAKYFSKHLPDTIRVTNGHDIVPHLPPFYYYFPRKTYHHFPREVWIRDAGVGSLVYMIEQICDYSGEDPSCSRSVSGDSVADHLTYLGVPMQSETWGTCSFFINDDMPELHSDPSGNFFLSRDHTALDLKPRKREKSSM